MNKRFRNLRPEEVSCRSSKVNKGGVQCLLYPKKFAVPDILDECVGSGMWSVEKTGEKSVALTIYGADGRNSTRIGTCDPETEGKSVVSEAIANAGAYFGIGRELYTAPEIFFWKDLLKNYQYNSDTREGVCYDKFLVQDITYTKDGNSIQSVTIAVMDCKDHKIYLTKTFGEETIAPADTGSGAKEEVPGVKATIKLTVKDADVPFPEAAPETADSSKEKDDAPLFDDGEKILIGNCKGQTYGEAKGTAVFASFLDWVMKSKTHYTQPERADQFMRFKRLALMELPAA